MWTRWVKDLPKASEDFILVIEASCHNLGRRHAGIAATMRLLRKGGGVTGILVLGWSLGVEDLTWQRQTCVCVRHVCVYVYRK